MKRVLKALKQVIEAIDNGQQLAGRAIDLQLRNQLAIAASARRRGR